MAQELLKYSAVVVQEVFKGDESLEDEACTVQPSEGDSDQLRAITEAEEKGTTEDEMVG